MQIKGLLLGLTFVTISSLGFSQTKKKNIKQKQVNQVNRIEQGVRSGELTKKETKQLKTQQRDIHQAKKMAKADGKVTREERRIIKQKQVRADKNIARKKHNDKTRK